MTADRPIYEPEVEELLRELAADPTSTLLRVPRKGIVPTLFDKHTMVSPRAAGLSSAERHLLQVYREDVALLLREAYYLYLQQGEPFGPALVWDVVQDRRFRLPTVEEWRRRAERALERPQEGDGAPEAHDVLALCVRESPVAMPSPVQLAVASLRLVPANQARIYVACDLQQSGMVEAGVRGFADILSQCSSSFHRSYCLQNMALAYEDMGDLDLASQLLAEASSIDESRSDPVMNWLFVSIQRMDTRSALDAARRIDRTLTPDHGALVDFVRLMLKSRMLGWWNPNKGVPAFISRIADRLGPASRSIAHVCQ